MENYINQLKYLILLALEPLSLSSEPQFFILFLQQLLTTQIYF